MAGKLIINKKQNNNRWTRGKKTEKKKHHITQKKETFEQKRWSLNEKTNAGMGWRNLRKGTLKNR
jgi:hypothetical protein